jgi:hypothetical protein
MRLTMLIALKNSVAVAKLALVFSFSSLLALASSSF